MNFRVSCELSYSLQNPATFLFALRCLNSEGQTVIKENLHFEPFVETEELVLPGGMNRFTRIQTLNPGPLNLTYEAEVEISPQIVLAQDLEAGDFSKLSADVLPYLFPSRYCQSDLLRQMGSELFGHLTTPFEIASAVSDWIFENISYVTGSTGENHSTIDTLDNSQGVCRDFAHLGISFCRALNVPARYTACYSYQLSPPDFHATFEAYIGNAWYLFDATRLVPLNGLVRIATGRDAADAAVCTIYGNPELTLSVVDCQCLDEDFSPITRDTLAEQNAAFRLP